MPGKHNAGGCNCCGPSCGNCDAITFFTIDGLPADDCDVCYNYNGTYAFRNEGDGFPGACYWFDYLPSQNCTYSGSVDSETLRYIIGPGVGCAGANAWDVEILNVTGGVQVRIRITLYYQVYNSHGSSTVGYTATFQKTFDDCASISGTLPLVATDTGVPCLFQSGLPPSFPSTDPGDLCGLYSATVTIG